MIRPRWLYGPPTQLSDPGDPRYSATVVRGVVLEPDTVRELVGLVDKHAGGASLNWIDEFSTEGPRENRIEPAAIEATPTWQLRKCAIQGDDGWTIWLFDGQALTVSNPGAGARAIAGGEYEELHRLVLAKLLAEGRPRIPWWRLRLLAPLLVVAATAAAVVWVIAATRPPLSVALLLVLLASLGSTPLVQNVKEKRAVTGTIGSGPGVGARIRLTSRVEDRQRRADNWAALKLAGITLPTGAALGVLGTLLIR